MTGEEKSEEQIHQEAMEEWLGVLAQLWTAAGKLIDADRLELYGRLLEEVPLGLLERAVARYPRERVPVRAPIGRHLARCARSWATRMTSTPRWRGGGRGGGNEKCLPDPPG